MLLEHSSISRVQKSRMLDFRNAREFFAFLKWDYSEQSSAIVFTDYESRELPLKWLKYLLLERVGLTTLQELDETIHRFPVADAKKAKNFCYQLLKSRNTENSNMIVLKVVFSDRAGQLPNFRIYRRSDIPTAFESALAQYMTEAQEIWLCQSEIAHSDANFGGRLSMPGNVVYAPSILEIVWFTSPRLLEEYRTKSFAYPFLRAYKRPGSLQFRLDELHLPEKWRVEPNEKERFLQDAQWVLYSLKSHREALDKLELILFGAGANELSIEFKASGGKFSIIDWDTEIETALC
jgi:hypothetical protein